MPDTSILNLIIAMDEIVRELPELGPLGISAEIRRRHNMIPDVVAIADIYRVRYSKPRFTRASVDD